MRSVLVALVCASAAACSRGGAEARTGVSAPATQTPAASAGIPHGDHNPHFGGIVLMNGDLHFEVVLRRDGQYRVYFSDAVRAELPAATAADVTVTISQKGRAPEAVPLQIDDNGESWFGAGHRIDDPEASARIAYTVHGQPYFIDVPVPR